MSLSCFLGLKCYNGSLTNKRIEVLPPRKYVVREVNLICEVCKSHYTLGSADYVRRAKISTNKLCCSRSCASKLKNGHSRIETIKRFWSFVNFAEGQGPNGDCWEWDENKLDSRGYACLSYEHKNRRATRFLFSFIRKIELTSKDLICHECDNPKCVKPTHLRIGTSKDNAQDCIKRGRKVTARGEDCYNSKLNEEDIREIFRLRKEEGLTHKEIAKIVGVHYSHISPILLGKKWKHVTSSLLSKSI